MFQLLNALQSLGGAAQALSTAVKGTSELTQIAGGKDPIEAVRDGAQFGMAVSLASTSFNPSFRAKFLGSSEG